MDWVCEIACTGDASRAEARAWVDGAVPAWKTLPSLTALDLYRPVEGRARDPFNDDGPGPLFIAMLSFPAREALANAMSRAALGGWPPGLALTATCFERRFYPVAGQRRATPLTA